MGNALRLALLALAAIMPLAPMLDASSFAMAMPLPQMCIPTWTIPGVDPNAAWAKIPLGPGQHYCDGSTGVVTTSPVTPVTPITPVISNPVTPVKPATVVSSPITQAQPSTGVNPAGSVGTNSGTTINPGLTGTAATSTVPATAASQSSMAGEKKKCQAVMQFV